MAGEDADLPMVSYPTAIQETLDLCIDVTVRAIAAMSEEVSSSLTLVHVIPTHSVCIFLP